MPVPTFTRIITLFCNSELRLSSRKWKLPQGLQLLCGPSPLNTHATYVHALCNHYFGRFCAWFTLELSASRSNLCINIRTSLLYLSSLSSRYFYCSNALKRNESKWALAVLEPNNICHWRISAHPQMPDSSKCTHLTQKLVYFSDVITSLGSLRQGVCVAESDVTRVPRTVRCVTLCGWSNVRAVR